MPEQTQTPAAETKPQAQTLTIRIPKVNAQVAVLGLLALVTVFQTAQLYALKGKAGGVSVKPAAAAAPAASGNSGSNAALPEMVGGC
ncbi:MAG: hypothetical protein AAB562_04265 [Patescibacteria group bacterium]